MLVTRGLGAPTPGLVTGGLGSAATSTPAPQLPRPIIRSGSFVPAPNTLEGPILRLQSAVRLESQVAIGDWPTIAVQSWTSTSADAGWVRAPIVREGKAPVALLSVESPFELLTSTVELTQIAALRVELTVRLSSEVQWQPVVTLVIADIELNLDAPWDIVVEV